MDRGTEESFTGQRSPLSSSRRLRHFGGQRVALLDRLPDKRPAFLRCQLAVPLNGNSFGGQLLILYDVPEPSRVIAPRKMVAPGIVVNAFRYLGEQDEVLGPEVQLPAR